MRERTFQEKYKEKHKEEHEEKHEDCLIKSYEEKS